MLVSDTPFTIPPHISHATLISLLHRHDSTQHTIKSSNCGRFQFYSLKALQLWWSWKQATSSHAKLFSTEKYLHAERIKHKVSNYMMILKAVSATLCLIFPRIWTRGQLLCSIFWPRTLQTWAYKFTFACSSLHVSLKSLDFWKMGSRATFALFPLTRHFVMQCGT